MSVIHARSDRRKRAARLPAICTVALLCSNVCLLALHSDSTYASARTDTARELIQSTSLLSILRTDAEEAAQVVKELPEELPPELRSDIRRAIDQNLGYNELEDELIRSAAQFTSARLDSNLRWWASVSGRAISAAEARSYTALLTGRDFESFDRENQASQKASNSATVAELMAAGRFGGFVRDLLATTGASRVCLQATVKLVPDCPPQGPPDHNPGTAEISQYIDTVTRASYSQVSSGDLDAYLVYLRADNAGATVSELRAATLRIIQQRWKSALQQAAVAIDQYAHSKFASGRDATLRDVTADIDEGRKLAQARITLEFLRRVGPPDAAVLVQLARVTLKLAPGFITNSDAQTTPHVDPASLATAQRWLDQALALDPNRAETLLIAGHLAYLKRNFKHSLDFLRQAEAIGTDSPWLHINMGETLWAMSTESANHTLARQAASEFETALRGKLPNGAEARITQDLGPIYAELGDLRQADTFYRRYESMAEGADKAQGLHRYARFLLFYAHDVDASVAAARQAVHCSDCEAYRIFLVDALTVKAGTLYAASRSAEAAAYIAEARQIKPDLESLCPDLATFPTTMPGVWGIHAAGLFKDVSGSLGGRTLVRASMFESDKEITQLLAWGADPNYFDADEGAPLHAAIMANNLNAVRVLLAHGANPLASYKDGRTPSQMAAYPHDLIGEQIRTLVDKAAGGRMAHSGPVGTPLKVGYRYRLKKAVSGDRWGNDFAAGEQVILIDDNCRYTDSALACFDFKKVNKPDRILDMALAKDQLTSWTDWFEELGPAASSR